jgi:hypothetical protein
MRFYELWEALNFLRQSLPEFTSDTLQTIANSVFGDCKQKWHGKVTCMFMNRYIGVSYDDSNRVVEIEFFWDKTPENLSTHNAAFTTAAELQPGTIEGVRKFGEFARRLKEHKVKIAFFSMGKRVQLYDRVLKSAGYTKSNEKYNRDDFLYLP